MSAACLVLTNIITKIRGHIMITECPLAKFQGTLGGGGRGGGGVSISSLWTKFYGLNRTEKNY